MRRRSLLAGALGTVAASFASRLDAALAQEVAAAMGDGRGAAMADGRGAAMADTREAAQRAAEGVPMSAPMPTPMPPPSAASRPGAARPLWLRRQGDEIAIPFRDAAGGYDRSCVARLSWFLRDTADRDRAVWMEPKLLDLLATVQSGLSAINGAPLPLLVTSAYRTPEHNAAIETAARNSLHLYGLAADVRMPPFSPRAVALAASLVAGGGIGLYDGFTHLDVGAIRAWTGPRQGPPALARQVEGWPRAPG